MKENAIGRPLVRGPLLPFLAAPRVGRAAVWASVPLKTRTHTFHRMQVSSLARIYALIFMKMLLVVN